MAESLKHVDYEKKNMNLIVTINTGEIDATNSYEVRSEIIELISKEDCQKVVLNLENMVYLDSTGLGIFVSILKRTSERDIELVMKNPNEKVFSLFKLTRLDKAFNIER